MLRSYHSIRTALAINIEEYVPVIIPTKNATINHFMLAPPKSKSAKRTSTTVSDVFKDLAKVSLKLWFTTSSKVWFLTFFIKFSRILSNTTIVSCTENPMMVRTAVMKRTSTSTPKNTPRRENVPTTINTSCTSATIALIPNFQDDTGFETVLKANAM